MEQNPFSTSSSRRAPEAEASSEPRRAAHNPDQGIGWDDGVTGGRTDIARVFFFFRPNQEIVCTNGYVKKTQKLDPSELAKAERYKADWEQRHP
jgi:hypothetical protein